MDAQRRAWGWVAALRQGSTTDWRDWPEGEDAEPTAARMPGAQQLGVLLRLNQRAAAQGRTVPTHVADRVLAADLAGRGRSELGLAGLDAAPDYGPRPVDPADLAPEELLRVVVSLVADDVAAGLDRTPPPPQRRTQQLAQRAGERLERARRSRSQGFVIVGVPWRVRAVEDALVAQGLRPGGREPVAYLLAEDLGTALAHAWTARSFDQGGHGWPGFVRAAASGGRVPPRADLLRMARAARERWGADQVRVVVDVDLLARDLGATAPVEEPAPLGAHAIELVRRVGEPLGLLVDQRLRPGLLRASLGRRLAGTGGPLPTVEPRWEAWLRAHAERTRHDLEAAGHVVLGDLDRLTPAPLPATPVVPDLDEVLALGLDLLLDPVLAPVRGGAR